MEGLKGDSLAHLIRPLKESCLWNAKPLRYFQCGSEEFRREIAQRKALAGEPVLREEPPAYDEKAP
jgi:hypothetical protein